MNNTSTVLLHFSLCVQGTQGKMVGLKLLTWCLALSFTLGISSGTKNEVLLGSLNVSLAD